MTTPSNRESGQVSPSGRMVCPESAITIWEDPGVGVRSMWEGRENMRTRAVWRFTVDERRVYGRSGHNRLELVFDRKLRGMEVDVEVRTTMGTTITLLDEQRVYANALTVSLPPESLRTIEVKLHRNLHKSPSLRNYRLGYRGRMASFSGVDSSFTRTSGLYFFADEQHIAPSSCVGSRRNAEIPMSVLRGAVASPLPEGGEDP